MRVFPIVGAEARQLKTRALSSHVQSRLGTMMTNRCQRAPQRGDISHTWWNSVTSRIAVSDTGTRKNECQGSTSPGATKVERVERGLALAYSDTAGHNSGPALLGAIAHTTTRQEFALDFGQSQLSTSQQHPTPRLHLFSTRDNRN